MFQKSTSNDGGIVFTQNKIICIVNIKAIIEQILDMYYVSIHMLIFDNYYFIKEKNFPLKRIYSIIGMYRGAFTVLDFGFRHQIKM